MLNKDLRGIEKVSIQVLLTFACMNLKKLANWKWKESNNTRQKSKIYTKIQEVLQKLFFFNQFA